MEAMLGEYSDISRPMFVPDYNTAAMAMQGVYQHHGQVWTLVVPKDARVHNLFSLDEAAQLLVQGALRLDWAGFDGEGPRVVLTAVGAYQLEQVLLASHRLSERRMPHSVVCMLEPGRFRQPRTEGEEAHLAPAHYREALYPGPVPARVIVTHTRPEPMLGVLRPLDTGWGKTIGLGFIGHGGTLDTGGMLFVNRCTWAHVLLAVANCADIPADTLLTSQELAALQGGVSPHGVVIQ